VSIVRKIKDVERVEQPKETMFIENDGYVYEVKMTFNHMDVVNVIEQYISLISVYDFEVLSKQDIEKEGMHTKFFPKVGKFRLEGNIKTTDNYFVPEEIRILRILFSIYKKDVLTQSCFNNLDFYFTILDQLKNPTLSKVIVDFLNKMDIQILNKYSLEELNYSVESLVKVKLDFQIAKAFSTVKDLLEMSKVNRERINRLGLNNKFIDIVKAKEKDQECDAIVAKVNEPFYKEYYKHI
jgi:hypothetical protein